MSADDECGTPPRVKACRCAAVICKPRRRPFEMRQSPAAEQLDVGFGRASRGKRIRMTGQAEVTLADAAAARQGELRVLPPRAACYIEQRHVKRGMT